jgi:WD40 repeat protein
VVSASNDKTLRVWNLDSGSCLQVLKGHSEFVTDIALTADDRAVSASADHTLRVWDLDTGACLMRYSADVAMYCTAISGDLSTVVAGDERGGFHILRLEDGEHRFR